MCHLDQREHFDIKTIEIGSGIEAGKCWVFSKPISLECCQPQLLDQFKQMLYQNCRLVFLLCTLKPTFVMNLIPTDTFEKVCASFLYGLFSKRQYRYLNFIKLFLNYYLLTTTILNNGLQQSLSLTCCEDLLRELEAAPAHVLAH